jgi:ribosomal protein S27AE
MTKVSFFRHRVACPKCGETAFAAEASEHMNPFDVDHSWRCWYCGSPFETLDHLKAEQQGVSELIKKGLPASFEPRLPAALTHVTLPR